MKLRNIKPLNRFFILFLALNLLLTVFYFDKGLNWNSTSRILPIMSYFEQGNFQIDKYKDRTGDISYINGHYYTDKAPLATMIVLPVYKVFVATGLIKRQNSGDDLPAIGVIASILTAVIPFLLLLFLILKKLIEIKPAFSPVLLVMSLYGGMIFVFSNAFYSHLLAGIFILSAYLMLKQRKFLWAGVFTGLAFATEFPLGVFLPVWALIILIKERSFLKSFIFSLGVLPFILFILYYNYYFTGSPFSMLYQFEAQPGFAEEFNQANTIFGFALPRLENVWEMIFGQYKGLLFYMPIFILIIFQLYKSLGKLRIKEITTSYLIIPSILFAFLIVSKSISWWGGWTYGPRYLIPLCFLLIYEGLIFLSKCDFSKIWFYGVAVFGLICAWMAKSTCVYSIPTEEKYPIFGYIFYKFKHGEFNQDNLLTFLFGISPKCASYCWMLLFLGSFILLFYQFKKYQKHEIIQ
ncbi:MAG: hypothetical protein WCH34_08365 [Bacteroidota bacterium]